MKSKILALGILMMILAFGVLVVGCEEEKDKSPTYYYEAFLITMAQYNSFIDSVSPGYNYTFSEIKGFRQTLKNYGGTFLESDAGITEGELKSFANQHGIGGSDYTQAKNSLDSVGNLILFGEYTLNPTVNVICMYVEKE